MVENKPQTKPRAMHGGQTGTATYLACQAEPLRLACRNDFPALGNPESGTPLLYALICYHNFIALRLVQISGDEALLSGGETLLSGDEALPSGGEMLLSGDEVLLSGGETLLSGDEALPSGGETLPSGDEALPSGGETLPTGKK